MKNIEHIQIDNQEETEIAQINNLQRNQQAIDEIRQQLSKQRQQPSAKFCEECGESIPAARRKAVLGVQLCVYCQDRMEKFKANYRQPDGN